MSIGDQALQRNELLIFSRWCQVMLRFEKSMYENPDRLVPAQGGS